MQRLNGTSLRCYKSAQRAGVDASKRVKADAITWACAERLYSPGGEQRASRSSALSRVTRTPSKLSGAASQGVGRCFTRESRRVGRKTNRVSSPLYTRRHTATKNVEYRKSTEPAESCAVARAETAVRAPARPVRPRTRVTRVRSRLNLPTVSWFERSTRPGARGRPAARSNSDCTEIGSQRQKYSIHTLT